MQSFLMIIERFNVGKTKFKLFQRGAKPSYAPFKLRAWALYKNKQNVMLTARAAKGAEQNFGELCKNSHTTCCPFAMFRKGLQLFNKFWKHQ